MQAASQAITQPSDKIVDDPSLPDATAKDKPLPLPLSLPLPPLSSGPLSRLSDISSNINSNITHNINVNSTSIRLIPHHESDVIVPASTSPPPENLPASTILPVDATAGSQEEGDIFGEGSSKPSPFIISLSQSPLWMPSELHRRLSLGLVPRLSSAEAGTSSASIFTSMLLEDTFETLSDKGTVLRGFQEFLSAVVDDAALNA
jgi:hypothetical protein